MHVYSLRFSLDYFSFLRAQPPEIVPKATTTNIFGARNKEEDQQDDILSSGNYFLRLIDL